MNLKRNILLAQNLMDDKFDYYDDFTSNMFSRIYPFTTENIKEYYKHINFIDKKILTVGSSADQILNSISMGCKNIDCFDLNPFVKYYYELKKSAILNFELKEFLEFFCYKNYPTKEKYNKNSFSYKQYLKLRNDLDNESKKFWDYLFLGYSGNDIRQRLFIRDEKDLNILLRANNYLNESEYLKIKTKFDNVNVSFLNSNIDKISSELNSDYDFIFLSNIASYLETIYSCDHLKKFKKIINNLDSHLSKDGKIYMAYLYNISEHHNYNKDLPIIFNLSEVYSLFRENELKLYDFDGLKKTNEKDNSQDAVLVYSKSKC